MLPGLREVHVGELEGGRFRVAFAERDPVFTRLLAEQRWEVIPGAESSAALAARVRSSGSRWRWRTRGWRWSRSGSPTTIARRSSASAASRSCRSSSSTTARSSSTRCRSSRCSRSAIPPRRCIRPTSPAARGRCASSTGSTASGRSRRTRSRPRSPRPSPTSRGSTCWPRRWRARSIVFERMLDGRAYLLGDEFSAADCAAYPFLKYAAWRDPADDELFHRVLDSYQQLGDDHPRLRGLDRAHRRAAARSDPRCAGGPRRSLAGMDAYLAVVSKREVRDVRTRDRSGPRPSGGSSRPAGSPEVSKNRQARRFVVVRDEACARRSPRASTRPTTCAAPRSWSAIVVGGKGPTSFDAGRAAQNMMLAASNDGVGSCPNGIADGAPAAGGARARR